MTGRLYFAVSSFTPRAHHYHKAATEAIIDDFRPDSIPANEWVRELMSVSVILLHSGQVP